jgi:hypothetical protein
MVVTTTRADKRALDRSRVAVTYSDGVGLVMRGSCGAAAAVVAVVVLVAAAWASVLRGFFSPAMSFSVRVLVVSEDEERNRTAEQG